MSKSNSAIVSPLSRISIPTPLSESPVRHDSASEMFRIESSSSFCAAAAALAAAPLARFRDGPDSSGVPPSNAGRASSSSKIKPPSYEGVDVNEEDGVEGRCFELELMQRRSQPEVLD